MESIPAFAQGGAELGWCGEGVCGVELDAESELDATGRMRFTSVVDLARDASGSSKL